jgi:hypothetical protein
MNANLLIKPTPTNYIVMCNIVFILFLSVLFTHIAKAHDISYQKKFIYIADFAYTTDSFNELDSGADDSVGNTNDASQKIDVPLKAFFVEAKAIFSLGHDYLMPYPRAPPK